MRLRKLRAKTAASLRNASDVSMPKTAAWLNRLAERSTSPFVRRKLKAAVQKSSSVAERTLRAAARKTWPLKPKVGRGEVFVPISQLGEEAQNAVKVIKSLIRPGLSPGDMPSLGIIGGTAVGAAAGAFFGIDAFVSRTCFGMVSGLGGSIIIALIAHKELTNNLHFLSNYFCNASNRRVAQLAKKYNFFFVDSKLGGVVFTKIRPQMIHKFRTLKQRELVIFDEKTNEVIYRGPERRGSDHSRSRDRRANPDRRSTIGKNTSGF